MKVHITQEDIDNAVPGESHRCILATALFRQFPDYYWDVGISYCHCMANELDSYYEQFEFPSHVAKIISEFEDGKKPKPFSFEWDVKLPKIETKTKGKT